MEVATLSPLKYSRAKREAREREREAPFPRNKPWPAREAPQKFKGVGISSNLHFLIEL